MMRTGIPVLPQPTKDNQFNSDLIRQLSSHLYNVFTDLSNIYSAVTVAVPAAMGNANSEISGLTFSATPTQAECNALRDKCEELADDVRVIHATLTALINSLKARGLV
jgi:hypothetical protein